MLDLSSEARHEYAIKLSTQLTQKGAKLATFTNCVEEFRDNLKAVLGNFERGEAFGETAARLRQLQFRLYASTLGTSLEQRLREVGVSVITDPNAPLHRHFPQAEEETLRTKITFHENWLARDRDAHSITNIIRLRSGRAFDFDQFSKCDYIFLSENAKLVKLATDYLINSNVYHERDVPPCLTDRYFAGLLWIMFGGESNTLAEARLIANCARAIQPRRDVIAKMHRILAGIDATKAGHFEAIMTSERGSHYFMQQTLGDSLLLNADNAEEIYAQLELAVGERVAREKDAEIEQLRQESAAAKDQQAEIYESKLREQEVARNEEKARHDSELQQTVATLGEQTKELRSDYEDKFRQVIEAKNTLTELEKTLADEQAAKERLEIRAIATAARKAVIARKRYKAVVIVALVGLFVILNWIDKYLLPTFDVNSISNTIGTPLYLLAQAIFFIGSLWFIPDRVFGHAAEKQQELVFLRELDEHAITEWQSRYTIDWTSGQVQASKKYKIPT